MRVSFGRTTQNSFPSGSASTVHDRAEGKDSLDLGFPVLRHGGQIEVQAVLDDLAVGHRHEADSHRAVSSGPITTSRSRSDRI